MGVPARRQESADRPAGRRNDVQEPPVESRCLHGSQIGLAKGAVQTGGWLPRVSLPRREEEGVIRGCSWGGTAINAWGVMPAPLSNSIYRRIARAHIHTYTGYDYRWTSEYSCLASFRTIYSQTGYTPKFEYYSEAPWLKNNVSRHMCN